MATTSQHSPGSTFQVEESTFVAASEGWNGMPDRDDMDDEGYLDEGDMTLEEEEEELVGSSVSIYDTGFPLAETSEELGEPPCGNGAPIPAVSVASPAGKQAPPRRKGPESLMDRLMLSSGPASDSEKGLGLMPGFAASLIGADGRSRDRRGSETVDLVEEGGEDDGDNGGDEDGGPSRRHGPGRGVKGDGVWQLRASDSRSLSRSQQQIAELRRQLEVLRRENARCRHYEEQLVRMQEQLEAKDELLRRMRGGGAALLQATSAASPPTVAQEAVALLQGQLAEARSENARLQGALEQMGAELKEAEALGQEQAEQLSQMARDREALLARLEKWTMEATAGRQEESLSNVELDRLQFLEQAYSELLAEVSVLRRQSLHEEDRPRGDGISTAPEPVSLETPEPPHRRSRTGSSGGFPVQPRGSLVAASKRSPPVTPAAMEGAGGGNSVSSTPSSAKRFMVHNSDGVRSAFSHPEAPASPFEGLMRQSPSPPLPQPAPRHSLSSQGYGSVSYQTPVHINAPNDPPRFSAIPEASAASKESGALDASPMATAVAPPRAPQSLASFRSGQRGSFDGAMSPPPSRYPYASPEPVEAPAPMAAAPYRGLVLADVLRGRGPRAEEGGAGSSTAVESTYPPAEGQQQAPIARKMEPEAPPYATDLTDRQMSDFSMMEAQLLALNIERGQLQSELDKLMPKTVRTIKDRQRMVVVESRLTEIGREASRLRIALKQAPS